MIEIVSTEFKKTEAAMQRCVDHFKNELSSLRAGRANPSILNKIIVDYYGTPTPLNQIANISVPEARLICITPWEPNMVKVVSKAILASDIGITPSDDGKIIRLPFPALTEERRKDLVKQLKKMLENAKVVLRNERRDLIDTLKKMQKSSAITEDDLKSSENEAQKTTDKFIELLEKIAKEKEAEILEI